MAKPNERQRKLDGVLLALIAARRAGVSITTLPTALGVSHGQVSGATERVRAADLEESGENVATVDGAYWARR